jgi:hypothetical protein
MRELADRAEEMQESHANRDGETKLFGVEVLQTVKVVFYVSARDEREAADKWLEEDWIDIDGDARPTSERVLSVREVGA